MNSIKYLQSIVGMFSSEPLPEVEKAYQVLDHMTIASITSLSFEYNLLHLLKLRQIVINDFPFLLDSDIYPEKITDREGSRMRISFAVDNMDDLTGYTEGNEYYE